MKYNNSTNFKQFLASAMAEIDAMNFTDDPNLNYNIENRFDLFHYWLTYNGVFDGGEDMLNDIKILVNN